MASLVVSIAWLVLIVGLLQPGTCEAPAASSGADVAPDHSGARFTKPLTEPVLTLPPSAVFDVAVLHADHVDGELLMWYSWRDKKSLGMARSLDGLRWHVAGEPVLSPRPGVAWEADINRPTILRRGGEYLMW